MIISVIIGLRDLIGMDRVTEAVTKLFSETNFNGIKNDECSLNNVHDFDNLIDICEYVKDESDGNDSDHDRNRDYAIEGKPIRNKYFF